MPALYRFPLLALTFAGLFALTACGQSDGAGGEGEMPPPEVAVVTVQQAPYTQVTELTGRVVPVRVAEIRPQVSGIITDRLFTEGAEVAAGATLYQIDPAPYRAALALAQANLASAEAQLVSVTARAQRYTELLSKQTVSRQAYDDAIAEQGVRRAAVASARAEVDTARINLDYAQVRAPIAGHIGRSRVTVGALVGQGQADMLTSITQLDPIHVDLSQSADALSALRRQIAAGQVSLPDGGKVKVSLTLADGTPYADAGSLEFAEVTVDAGTGTVALRALFPNARQELLPGMFVRAQVEQGTRPDAILVPQQGVTLGAGGIATALVVDKDDKVEQRNVRAERAVGDQWLVTDGLKPGDRLVVQGVQKAQPGMAVKPVPLPARAADAAPAR